MISTLSVQDADRQRQVVALLNELSGAKRLCVVRRDGSCTWKSETGEEEWRPSSFERYGWVLSASWRPFSAERSILALGFHDAVVFCDATGNEKHGTRKERRIEIPSPASLISWSPQGRVLFVASNERSRVITIDAALGCVDGSIRPVGFRNGIHSLSWSSSNKLFVSGSVVPVFRLFSEALQVLDTWTSIEPVLFGSWSKDGNRMLCGNASQGVVLIDIKVKRQWLLINPEMLEIVLDKARKDGIYNPVRPSVVTQITWDPVKNNAIILVLDNPRGAALFRTSQLGDLMGCTYVKNLPLRAEEFPITKVEFLPSGKLAVGYSDASVEILTVPSSG